MKRRREGERPEYLTWDNRVPLLKPVNYVEGDDPRRIDELQLRRLNAADLLILDETTPYTDKQLRIVASMTGLPRVVLLKLDAVDVDRIDDVLGYFREPGSATGATS